MQLGVPIFAWNLLVKKERKKKGITKNKHNGHDHGTTNLTAADDTHKDFLTPLSASISGMLFGSKHIKAKGGTVSYKN